MTTEPLCVSCGKGHARSFKAIAAELRDIPRTIIWEVYLEAPRLKPSARARRADQLLQAYCESISMELTGCLCVWCCCHSTSPERLREWAAQLRREVPRDN